MRHGNKLNRLSRTHSHRRSLLSNLACELISHKRITTTLAKARSLRVFVEPLITKSKTNTTHQRRVVFSYLEDKEAVNELFTHISGKIASRPGGYTRIIKLGKRLGDASEMALIELVDYNELYTKAAPGAKTASAKRTRRGSKKKTEETEKPEAASTTAEEARPAASPEATTETEAKTAAEAKTAGKEGE